MSPSTRSADVSLCTSSEALGGRTDEVPGGRASGLPRAGAVSVVERNDTRRDGIISLGRLPLTRLRRPARASARCAWPFHVTVQASSPSRQCLCHISSLTVIATSASGYGVFSRMTIPPSVPITCRSWRLPRPDLVGDGGGCVVWVQTLPLYLLPGQPLASNASPWVDARAGGVSFRPGSYGSTAMPPGPRRRPGAHDREQRAPALNVWAAAPDWAGTNRIGCRSSTMRPKPRSALPGVNACASQSADSTLTACT